MQKDRTEYFKNYRETHKEQEKARSRKHYLEHKEEILERTNKWYQDNKEKHNQLTKDYYQENKEKIQEQHREYYQKNKDKVNKKRKEKLKIDNKFKIRKNLGGRLRGALKGNTKSSSITKLIGCSLEKLKNYLESQFKPGMSWDNYGRKKGIECWEIDHIVPCIKFDLSKESEQRKCFFFKNLQPLWAKENQSKNRY
ncbi:MAG: hypothetical protein R6U15_07635 [Candidatus Izemoplasmatales bacterium]